MDWLALAGQVLGGAGSRSAPISSGQSLNVSGFANSTLADLAKLQSQAWWSAPSYMSGAPKIELPTLPGIPTLPQLPLVGAQQYAGQAAPAIQPASNTVGSVTAGQPAMDMGTIAIVAGAGLLAWVLMG
jgi:hypothetical protein